MKIIKFCKRYKKLTIFTIILTMLGLSIVGLYNYVYPLYKTQRDIPYEWDKGAYVESKVREELKQAVVGIYNGHYATGVIIGRDKESALILTNAHVALGIHPNSKIHFIGDEYNIAVKNIKVIGIDLFSDIALIVIKPPAIVKFKRLKIATESVELGDKVYTLGNPLGIDHIYTEGKVIYKNTQKIYVSNPIAPGASGSPLVNENGKIVGLVHAVSCTPLKDTKWYHTHVGICVGRERIVEFVLKYYKEVITNEVKSREFAK